MKKILLGVALISSFAMAESLVVEPKVNFGLAGSKVNNSVQTVKVKKPLTVGVEVRKADPVLELGGGIDLSTSKVNAGSRMRSIPVYAVAKYKFSEVKGVNPYIKGKLGYSFNSVKNGGSELKIKAGNGIHFGVGAGVTYNNWNAELAYNSNTHKLSVTDTKNKKSHTQSPVSTGGITLNLGYNFNVR